jgi:type IV pilus assembly protein PilO
MKLQDLNSLNIGNVGSWPAPAKAGAIAILCVAVLGAGYWLDTRAQLGRLEQAENQEQQKRAAFEQKQFKAANLEPLRQQLDEMKQSFGAMVRQLPNQAEIEALLVDISQTGLASGLEFELFEPQAESPRDFYAEKPIKLRVTGSYHEFGEFVSGVAALPRIVTQHEITIRPKNNRKSADGQADASGDAELVMEATAKTYRYLEEGSTTPQPSAASKTKGKGAAKGSSRSAAKSAAAK